jgi:ABC-type multidrug transport system fused ATPase/permease subunit
MGLKMPAGSYFKKLSHFYRTIEEGTEDPERTIEPYPETPRNDGFLNRLLRIKEEFSLNAYEFESIKIAFSAMLSKREIGLFDVLKILHYLYNKQEFFFLRFFQPEAKLIIKNVLQYDNREIAYHNYPYVYLSEIALFWIIYGYEEFFEKKAKTTPIRRKRKTQITPQKIYSSLKEHVIGQDDVLKRISLECANHHLRISSPESCGLKKNNILFIGPTGSGKTFIMQNLGKLLDIPVLIVDASELTDTGYVGRGVQDILRDLLSKASR